MCGAGAGSLAANHESFSRPADSLSLGLRNERNRQLGVAFAGKQERLMIDCQTTSVSATHATHCATTALRVGRSYEHFPDGF